MTLKNIKAIFKRELGSYFSSPVAYVFIVIFLLLQGFFTFNLSNFFENGQADLKAFFKWHPWIFMFLVPSVGMRLWSEERRLGTLELLMTLPVTITDAILGKFLAAWCFLSIAVLLTFPIVLSTIYLGEPDLGVIAGTYIGSLLMAGAFLSVAIMTSSLTRSQVISFILAVTISLFFVLSGFPDVTALIEGWAPLWMVNIMTNISFFTHFTSIQRGVFDLRDFVYYFSIISFMLFFNGLILQSRRTT